MKAFGLLLILLLAAFPAGADETATCRSANLFGSALIDKVCWSCLFPVGWVGNGPRPDGHNRNFFCSCEDSLGVPHLGIASSMWVPVRIVELTREPYCLMALNGVRFPGDSTLYGTPNDGKHGDMFMNYHEYAFPLVFMLGLLTSPRCLADSYTTFDVVDLSELLPVWNEDEVAIVMSPEAAVVANPLAILACSTADCAARSSGTGVAYSEALNRLFWCIGCWGNLYPFTGTIDWAGSPPRDTSLLASRAIAWLHRQGRARKTYGTENMCGGQIYPMLPKTQYRMQQFYPVAEAEGQCCHPMGESQYKWGEWRNIPGMEDYLYIVWRYTDCCL